VVSASVVTAVTLFAPSVSAPPLLATSVSLTVTVSRASRRTEPFRLTELVALAWPS
jgi:hypothetical protein